MLEQLEVEAAFDAAPVIGRCGSCPEVRERAAMGQGHSSEGRCKCEGRRVLMGCDVLSESSFSRLKGRRVSGPVVPVGWTAYLHQVELPRPFLTGDFSGRGVFTWKDYAMKR